ncbi:MAG: DUF1330 domain-containing protein [Acidimicrobiia bacterium]|nr:DUF1330 domain-containing protein [Acidimicrobiia bacterium]
MPPGEPLFVDPSSVEPTTQQLAAFVDADPGPGSGPLRMVNLLKFRETACYTDEPDPGGTGAEAYGRYAEVALRKVSERGGRIVTALEAGPHLVGDPDVSWDQVVVVEYPDRAAFLDMIADPEYLAVLRHRDAGLERTELIPATVLMEDVSVE